MFVSRIVCIISNGRPCRRREYCQTFCKYQILSQWNRRWRSKWAFFLLIMKFHFVLWVSGLLTTQPLLLTSIPTFAKGTYFCYYINHSLQTAKEFLQRRIMWSQSPNHIEQMPDSPDEPRLQMRNRPEELMYPRRHVIKWCLRRISLRTFRLWQKITYLDSCIYFQYQTDVRWTSEAI